MKGNKVFPKKEKKYFSFILVLLFFLFVLSLFTKNPEWVEKYYSTGFYPVFAKLNKFLFSWASLSIGDVFYALLLVCFIYLVYLFIKHIIRLEWLRLRKLSLQSMFYLLLIYTFFMVNWGVNYLRPPVYELIGLDVYSLNQKDYEHVLEKYIPQMNALRSQIDLEDSTKVKVRNDLELYMKNDTLYNSFLTKTQVKIKEPISNSLISYLGVAGYFNPFTSEVQVNQDIPKASFPFVNVHELVHQMGVGFEDDCNFIAFRKLIYHENIWYQYSAYFNAIRPLLSSISHDKGKVEKYRKMLSKDVLSDFEKEYQFWNSHTGWLNSLSSYMYDGYLKHNNQPEGIQRYNMMARLIVAWELQQ